MALELVPVKPYAMFLSFKIRRHHTSQKCVEIFRRNKLLSLEAKVSEVGCLLYLEFWDKQIRRRGGAWSHENHCIVLRAVENALEDLAGVFSACHCLTTCRALLSMRVSIERHDYRLYILFDEFEGLSRGRTVTVNERLLTKGGAQQCVEMAANDVISYVVKNAHLVFVELDWFPIHLLVQFNYYS